MGRLGVAVNKIRDICRDIAKNIRTFSGKRVL